MVRIPFAPHFWTTHVGSLPHTDCAAVGARLAAMLDVPAWPQLPRRTFRESMYVQFSASLPRIAVDEARQKIAFDTSGDMAPDLEAFYARYLADDLDAFALNGEYAAGFQATLDALSANTGEWVKGQVVGPISFGLAVTDQSLRASLYHDLLADVIVKNMAMSARWQARRLRAVRPNVMIFVDEPYLASFGSAYISLSREQVIAMLDEVFAAIHAEGAWAGAHCCANTDWSVLLATAVDILSLDAYGYLENLALYAAELRAFLDRGGIVAWGIVPNDDDIHAVTPRQVAQRLRDGVRVIAGKAQTRGLTIRPDDWAARSFVTPRCGLGATSVTIAEKVLDDLARTGEILRRG
jgi:hypothetical protein